MTALAEQFAEQAKDWAGVPYEHRGTTRHGCDCTGLIIGALRELGYMGHYRLRNYNFQWNLHAGAGDYLRQELATIAEPVDDRQPGDIVVFRFGKCLAHAGIAVSPDLFVHALSTIKRVGISHFNARLWKSRQAGTWRLNPDKLRRFS